jgi:hypothetical protein
MKLQRRHLLGTALLSPLLARAHHGWSGFDSSVPIYLEGRIAAVQWGNPHATLDLEPTPGLRLPSDLGTRALPAQQARVDGAALLARAQVPRRAAPRWTIELAPLMRMDAWKIRQPQVGETVSMIGFVPPGEQGPPVLRVEYLFLDGRAYGLRSSPA